MNFQAFYYDFFMFLKIVILNINVSKTIKVLLDFFQKNRRFPNGNAFSHSGYYVKYLPYTYDLL